MQRKTGAGIESNVGRDPRRVCADRMTTTTLPSGTGVVSSYSYDNADRLTSLSHVKGLADHYDQIVPLM